MSIWFKYVIFIKKVSVRLFFSNLVRIFVASLVCVQIGEWMVEKKIKKKKTGSPCVHK